MTLIRLRSLTVVLLMIAAIVALPALLPRATAAPRSVTVATRELTPFVMSEGNLKTGFTIDLLDEIAKHTGWTYTYVTEPNVQELLKAVAERRVDIGASAISITGERARNFDFSQPILNGGLQIIAPVANTQHADPGLVDFVRLLFSKTMAVWLWAALVLTILPAHLIWFMERGDAESMVSRKYFPGIFQAFGWGLGMLSAAPFDPPRQWPIRIVTVLWTFVSIIFVAYYTAILTTNFTVARINSQIKSPSDLIGKTVCTVANTTSAPALTKLGVDFTAVPKIDDCFAGFEKKDFETVVYDAPVLQYYVAHRGAGIAAVAGPVFKDEDYGVAFPIGSDLRRQFDDALLAVQEDGEFDRLKQKWFGSA
ncbi:MAG TPA: transporter substrate-binding domain-containing protein [Mycobacterium sp.]|uniref:transporter substrate-binding domain-containing protein n=1 Tax=Mycolicibacterium sp. TaxID=2320850 RepID=UPI0025DFD044|nr:transporter substrate-binding domain-containing protein [Mycolicibacterium sp.]HPX37250.1 transporter substrate-binding domain-containing protein [Mycobacterium sp.]HQC77488.1 transporter substrate-binding domain-containing protein [Mycobacterium sp.]